MSTVEKQIRYLADRMGLADWRFTVVSDNATADSWAEVEVVYGRRLATVHLSPEWDSLPPAEQKEVLVHELVHVHLGAFGHLVADLLESQKVEGLALAAIEAALTHAEEWMVDCLSTAWAKTL